jgi:hypothetical protein
MELCIRMNAAVRKESRRVTTIFCQLCHADVNFSTVSQNATPQIYRAARLVTMMTHGSHLAVHWHSFHAKRLITNGDFQVVSQWLLSVSSGTVLATGGCI